MKLTDDNEVVLVYVEDSRYSAIYMDGKLRGEFKDITAEDILEVLGLFHSVVCFESPVFPENFDKTLVVKEDGW